MIDQQTVTRIIERAEIVDVVQDFVHLKRRGVNFLGLCPFHGEKTPSFTVSPSKGIYKCFGCGKAGNAVGFIMEHEQLSYPDALRYLAKKYQIEITEQEVSPEQIEEKNHRESMMVLTGFAQKYFTDILFNDREGQAIGLSYFKERGFTKETIEKFQLGYSPENRTAFTGYAQKNGYQLKYLLDTGLSIDKNNYHFDRFAGRVIFPIHALAGNPIAFGGRILKAVENTAKYLNSPESEIYHKSDVLYGIYFAKREIVKQDKCYMVEGYTDVISFHQAGIENVVASSGTSLTENQIRLVKRFTDNLTILYDGDAAGIKASFRGIDMVLEQGMNIKVVLFPDGEDPDSFSKKLDKRELKEFIRENEDDFIRFKTRLLLDDAKNDPVKKSGLISNIVRSVAVIPDAITRSMYIKECSAILNVQEDALYAEINKILFQKRENERKQQFSETRQQLKQTQTEFLPGFIDNVYAEVDEKEIISSLIKFGEKELFTISGDDPFSSQSVSVAAYIINEILNDELEFKNLIYRQIFEDYASFFHKGEFLGDKYFIHNSDEKIRVLAADIFTETYKPSAIWTKGGKKIDAPEQTLKTDIPKTINSYKLKILQMAIKDNEEQLKKARVDDIETINQLLMQKKILIETKRKLADETGGRIIFGHF
jgi:DNA primase